MNMLRNVYQNARRLSVSAVVVGLLAGCSVNSLVDVQKPSNILDPDALKTYNGAINLYNGAMTQFLKIFNGGNATTLTGPYAVASGVLADEYTLPGLDALDARSDVQGQSSGGQFTYRDMTLAYVNAGQAQQYLKAYASNAPKTLLANTFIARGYIALFISELFCNGVPLSEASFDGSITFGVALSRDSLQNFALAQFDSALVYAETDSIRAINIAKLGRARVFLDAKAYDKAAAAVAGIPTSFSYDLQYNNGFGSGTGFFQPGGTGGNQPWSTVSDMEGTNGLNFRTANDPRVQVDLITNINGMDIYELHKFRVSGTIFVPLDNGIDARLIEAEYLLSQGQTSAWLDTLNSLRTTCTSIATCPTPAPAGSGGVAGLPPLTDPGTAAGRVQLLFRERAFWLFGTGHRQGDLRRLVRQYGLPQSQVYPTGSYQGGNGALYGTYTNATPGPDELTANPNYKGCIDREA